MKGASPASPSPSASGGGNLPKTGAGTSVLVAGGVVLILFGIGAFALGHRLRA